RSTARPRPARPIASCQKPTMKVSVITSCTYAGEPGAARGPTRPSTVSEIAFAGPVTIRRLAPKSAAITHGTIALYRPYSGGIPASVANATPCGSTTIAPVSPAIKSARTVARSRSSGSHARNGRKRSRRRRSVIMRSNHARPGSTRQPHARTAGPRGSARDHRGLGRQFLDPEGAVRRHPACRLPVRTLPDHAALRAGAAGVDLRHALAARLARRLPGAGQARPVRPRAARRHGDARDPLVDRVLQLADPRMRADLHADDPA